MASPAEILQSNWPIFVKYGVAKSCSYQKMVDPVYDPATGVVTGDVESSHTLLVVFDQIKKQYPGAGSIMSETTIQQINKVAIFPVLDLSVVPAINDTIIDHNSKVWRVFDIVGDPADAHYELLVRALS